MKKFARLLMIVCVSVAAIALTGSFGQASEHAMAAPESGGCPGAQRAQAGTQPPMACCGTKCQEYCQEMMDLPMQGGCRSMMPMMHHMMGPMMPPLGMGMEGMMSGPPDPKAVGRMLQMRGDVLKAVGEVLLKYGKEMAAEGK